jgi:hypothetical protein
MPSANPSIAVPKPAQKVQPFHRIPRNARAATLPERKPVIIAAANDPSYWANSVWCFYDSTFVGNTYTWAAQLNVYGDLSYLMFLYSASTYNGCQRSVLETLQGTLGVYSDPSWLDFQSTGDERLCDTCDPSLNYDNPIDVDYRWLVNPYDQTGGKWEFQNSAYGQPFNNFVFTRIK